MCCYKKFIIYVSLCIFTAYTVFSTIAEKDMAYGELKLSIFDIDATPPVGSQLAYQPMVNTSDMSLRARGVVIFGSGLPIVLCSVDWIGIANYSQDAFKNALADAAETIPQRVAIHTVHQHDAPRSDFGAEKLLIEAGLDPMSYESSFQRELIDRLSAEVKKSVGRAETLTHIGLGKAEVYKVASNRRIIGEDGKIRAWRGSTSRDPKLRAEPEGIIDPMISLVSFWNNEEPMAVLCYYANHPMSYYLTGLPNPDYPGVARFMRQLAVPQALHIYFNGAGGNLAAGKYNDGSMENRLILAQRLADGMKRAWEATRKEPITASDAEWDVDPVVLPHAPFIENLRESMASLDPATLTRHIVKLVWLNRLQEGKKIDISCLSIGSARILHMPGELCVEYQLAAKEMRPDLFVTMAAYGDYAPGYICVARGYYEGGYEAGEASGVTAEAEEVILTSMRKLLKVNE
jgi:hypothetical protein